MYALTTAAGASASALTDLSHRLIHHPRQVHRHAVKSSEEGLRPLPQQGAGQSISVQSGPLPYYLQLPSDGGREGRKRRTHAFLAPSASPLMAMATRCTPRANTALCD